MTRFTRSSESPSRAEELADVPRGRTPSRQGTTTVFTGLLIASTLRQCGRFVQPRYFMSFATSSGAERKFFRCCRGLIGNRSPPAPAFCGPADFRARRRRGSTNYWPGRGLILWVRVTLPRGREAPPQEDLLASRAEAVRSMRSKLEKAPRGPAAGHGSAGPWLGSEPLARP